MCREMKLFIVIKQMIILMIFEDLEKIYLIIVFREGHQLLHNIKNNKICLYHSRKYVKILTKNEITILSDSHPHTHQLLTNSIHHKDYKYFFILHFPASAIKLEFALKCFTFSPSDVI